MTRVADPITSPARAARSRHRAARAVALRSPIAPPVLRRRRRCDRPAGRPAACAIDPDVPVIENIAYGTRRHASCSTPACPRMPTTSSVTRDPRAAIVVVHGGSWRAATRPTSHWRSVCQWLASDGLRRRSRSNYRLAPAVIRSRPARRRAHRRRLAARRRAGGPLRHRPRPHRRVRRLGRRQPGVAARHERHGPARRRHPGRRGRRPERPGRPHRASTAPTTSPPVQLDVPRLRDRRRLPAARSRVAGFSVDADDPPFFVAPLDDEFIPLAQSDALRRGAARCAASHVTFVDVDGRPLHSIAHARRADLARRAQSLALLRAPPRSAAQPRSSPHGIRARRAPTQSAIVGRSTRLAASAARLAGRRRSRRLASARGRRSFAPSTR